MSEVIEFQTNLMHVSCILHPLHAPCDDNEDNDDDDDDYDGDYDDDYDGDD